jgi:rod shape-determining protein MreC
MSSDVADFIALSSINDSLAEANKDLIRQVLTLQDQVEAMKALNDTVPELLPEYELHKAKVVYNSVSRLNNYLLLDKGEKDGIEAGMGVISPQGVIGIVRSVNNRYALVMSLLHTQARISASIRHTNYFGSLIWKGRKTKVAWLENIPKYVPVAKGDTIETSGNSFIFPKGILIGRVDTVWDQTSDISLNIQVGLFQDLGNLDYVYVVESLEKEAKQELLDQTTDE